MIISEFTPDKIESLPTDIQKLVWRALFYKSQVTMYEREYALRKDDKIFEKLNKYREAFKNMQEILNKICKSMALESIIIVD